MTMAMKTKLIRIHGRKPQYSFHLGTAYVGKVLSGKYEIGMGLWNLAVPTLHFRMKHKPRLRNLIAWNIILWPLFIPWLVGYCLAAITMLAGAGAIYAAISYLFDPSARFIGKVYATAIFWQITAIVMLVLFLTK
jgi:hypothetical protein